MIRRTVMHGTLAAIAGVSLFAAFEYATAPTTVRPGHTAYVDASCEHGVTAHADIYVEGADLTVTIDGASAFKHVPPNGGSLHVPNPDPTAAHTWSVDITATDWAPFHTSGEIPPCQQKPTTTTVAPTTSTSTTSTPPSSTSTTSSVAQSSTTAPEAPTSSTAATSSTTAATSSPSTTPTSSVHVTDSSQPTSTSSTSSTTHSTPPAITLPGTR